MTQRGHKLRRIRRLLGGTLPATGVTKVFRPSTSETRSHRIDAATAPADDGLGADDHGRPRTAGRFGSYRGVHRRAAA